MNLYNLSLEFQGLQPSAASFAHCLAQETSCGGPAPSDLGGYTEQARGPIPSGAQSVVSWQEVEPTFASSNKGDSGLHWGIACSSSSLPLGFIFVQDYRRLVTRTASSAGLEGQKLGSRCQGWSYLAGAGFTDMSFP